MHRGKQDTKSNKSSRFHSALVLKIVVIFVEYKFCIIISLNILQSFKQTSTRSFINNIKL